MSCGWVICLLRLGRCVTLFCCVEFTIGFLLGLLAVASVVVVWFGCFVDCG